jgi:GAF domain-containing protein
MSDYTTFLAAMGRDQQPARAFDALEQLAKDLVGVKLFTITTSNLEQKESERVYSNMPEAYPISGTKPYIDDIWSETTLHKRATFVANTIDDIAEVFNDFELIRSLGCESVINVPIVIDDEVVGTVNCLHEKGFYTDEKVRAAEALKLPAAICMMLHDKKKGSR